MLHSIALIQTTIFSLDEEGVEFLQFLNQDIFFGSIGLIFTTHLLVLKKNYWKHIFFVLLLAVHTPYISLFNVHFYFGFMGVGFDFIPMAILVFHSVQFSRIFETSPFKYLLQRKKSNVLSLRSLDFN